MILGVKEIGHAFEILSRTPVVMEMGPLPSLSVSLYHLSDPVLSKGPGFIRDTSKAQTSLARSHIPSWLCEASFQTQISIIDPQPP